jgi:hypothetical protein
MLVSVSLGNSWFGEKGWYKRPPYGWPSAMNGGGFSYDVPLLLRVSIIFQLSNGSTFKINSSANGTIGLMFYSTHGLSFSTHCMMEKHMMVDAQLLLLDMIHLVTLLYLLIGKLFHLHQTRLLIRQ